MGGKTYVVSIPSEYVKKYGLKKGDELFFEDSGSNLVFKNEKAKAAEKLIVTIKEQDNLGKVMKCLYERGYDEIEIIFENRPFEELGKILMLLPGFELVLSGKSSCTIRCISNINAKEFENRCKHMFFFLFMLFFIFFSNDSCC